MRLSSRCRDPHLVQIARPAVPRRALCRGDCGKEMRCTDGRCMAVICAEAAAERRAEVGIGLVPSVSLSSPSSTVTKCLRFVNVLARRPTRRDSASPEVGRIYKGSPVGVSGPREPISRRRRVDIAASSGKQAVSRAARIASDGEGPQRRRYRSFGLTGCSADERLQGRRHCELRARRSGPQPLQCRRSGLRGNWQQRVKDSNRCRPAPKWSGDQTFRQWSSPEQQADHVDVEPSRPPRREAPGCPWPWHPSRKPPALRRRVWTAWHRTGHRWKPSTKRRQRARPGGVVQST